MHTMFLFTSLFMPHRLIPGSCGIHFGCFVNITVSCQLPLMFCELKSMIRCISVKLLFRMLNQITSFCSQYLFYLLVH